MEYKNLLEEADMTEIKGNIFEQCIVILFLRASDCDPFTFALVEGMALAPGFSDGPNGFGRNSCGKMLSEVISTI